MEKCNNRLIQIRNDVLLDNRLETKYEYLIYSVLVDYRFYNYGDFVGKLTDFFSKWMKVSAVLHPYIFNALQSLEQKGLVEIHCISEMEGVYRLELLQIIQ